MLGVDASDADVVVMGVAIVQMRSVDPERMAEKMENFMIGFVF